MKEIEEGKKKGMSCGWISCGCLTAVIAAPVLMFVCGLIIYCVAFLMALSSEPRTFAPKIMSDTQFADLNQRFDEYLAKTEFNANIWLTEEELNSLIVKRFGHKDVMVKVDGDKLIISYATKSIVGDQYFNCDFEHYIDDTGVNRINKFECDGQKTLGVLVGAIGALINLEISKQHQGEKITVSLASLSVNDSERGREYVIKNIKDGKVEIIATPGFKLDEVKVEGEEVLQ